MYYAEKLSTPCANNYSYFTTNIACWFRMFFKAKIECFKFYWPSKSTFTYLAYLNKLVNLGDEEWVCVNDCNFKITFAEWSFTSRSKSMITPEKYLMKFFYKRNSKTSNDSIFPVVTIGIVNRTISYAESGLFLWIISEPVHESNSKIKFGPTLENTFLTQVSK